MAESRRITVPAQGDQFTRVVDDATGGMVMVFGPAAPQVRAAAGGSGVLEGDWNLAAREVTALAFTPDGAHGLPEERYGNLEVPTPSSPLRFVVREGRWRGRSYAVPEPLASELRPLVGGQTGSSAQALFITGAWDESGFTVAPTAFRLATVGDGMTILPKEETGRGQDQLVSTFTATAARESVAKGQASWTPPSAADAYHTSTGFVPTAVQGHAVTSSGDLHPDVFREGAQLAQVLSDTATARGTSLEEEVARIGGRFLEQGADPAQVAAMVGDLEERLGLAPGGGGRLPWGLIAAAAAGLFLLRGRR